MKYLENCLHWSKLGGSWSKWGWRGGSFSSFLVIVFSFFVTKEVFVNVSCLTDASESKPPYVRAFFNYLSIVEMCIDKSLSGRDLCSCQLSQRKAPSDTNRIDRHAKHNWEAFWGRDDSPRACGPERGEQAEELKTSSLGESIGPAGLWPEGDRESGRRVSRPS